MATSPSTPPETKRAPADYFSGTAWLTMLVPPGTPTDCTVGDVYFEPGCRNSWHRHPHGQVLVVTAGAGYYQERGQPARLLHPGEAVSIAPGVVHWHGATATTAFAHYAINPSASQGAVEWLAPVTDEEYRAAHQPV